MNDFTGRVLAELAADMGREAGLAGALRSGDNRGHPVQAALHLLL